MAPNIINSPSGWRPGAKSMVCLCFDDPSKIYLFLPDYPNHNATSIPCLCPRLTPSCTSASSHHLHVRAPLLVQCAVMVLWTAAIVNRPCPCSKIQGPGPTSQPRHTHRVCVLAWAKPCMAAAALRSRTRAEQQGPQPWQGIGPGFFIVSFDCVCWEGWTRVRDTAAGSSYPLSLASLPFPAIEAIFHLDVLDAQDRGIAAGCRQTLCWALGLSISFTM